MRWICLLIWTGILAFLPISARLVGGSGWPPNHLPLPVERILWFLFMSMFLVPANIYDEGSTNRQQPQHHQEQQQPQPSLAPNIDRLSTGLTRDTSDVAASAPADEVYLSHSHQSLRATPSLPTYEDAVTHQGFSAVSEPQMTLPTYEEAEAL